MSEVATACYECGARTFRCASCGGPVPLAELIDVFHVGECPNCGAHEDEPCPERTRPKGVGRLRRWSRILGRLANPFGPWAG